MSQRILLEIRQQLGFKPPAPSFHDWMKDHPSFLVRIWAYGGLCPDGPCGGETIIDKSGRIFRSRFSNQQGSLVGSLNDKTMAELSHRIEHIDLAKIAASHHVGTCSSASDGPDEELTFNTSAGITTIDSCKNEFNAASFDLYKSFIDAIRKATKP